MAPLSYTSVIMDKLDLEILNTLQKNARTSISEIARKTGKAPSGILERVKKLESNNIIEGYHAKLNDKAVELGLLAFVFVKVKLTCTDRVGLEIIKIPAVQEVYEVVGEYTYLAKIRTSSTDELSNILTHDFGKIEDIISTQSTIALKTFKDNPVFPLNSAIFNKIN